MVIPTTILAGQIVKIIAGLAQLGFGIWLVSRVPRSATNSAFAIFFGANGIAYVIFNLGLPGQRTAGTLALEGRAVFNWIATVAMLVFAALLMRSAQWPKLAAFVGALVASTVFAADLLAGAHMSLMQFGGIAIYPATALALGMFPILFMSDFSAVGQSSAWLGGALAINSVDHLGAEIISPSPTPETAVLLQISAMAVVLCLWLAAGLPGNGRRWKPIVFVTACMVLPFVAGIFVRVVAGSYLGVQRSGFIGIGRLLTTGLLTYGMIRGQVFSEAPGLTVRARP